MQNLQRQAVEELNETPLLSAVPSLADAATPPPVDILEEEENVWAVWPYCWATAAWDLAQERFHSFHENLTDWHMARINRRNQEKFQADFWQSWNNNAEGEERELRLV